MDTKFIYDPTPIYLRKRYLIFFLAFFGHINLYTMRVDFSVAITALAENQTICNADGELSFHQDLTITSKERGIALSTYFYGYIATQLIGGYVASKINGRLIFGGGILGAALMTFLTPLLFYYGIFYIYALRIVIGVFSGLSYPSLYAVYDKWCPPCERSRVALFGISGVYLGNIIGMTLSDFILENYRWEWIFHGFGILATLWVIVWFTITKESPDHDKWIMKSEKKFILESLNHYRTKNNNNKTPWLAIFTSMPVYATTVAYFAYSWGYATAFTAFPEYMKDLLMFDVPKSGMVNSTPCLFISVLLFPSGYLADWIINKNILSTSQVRKFFNNISFFGQMVFLLLGGYSTNQTSIFVYISLSVGIGAFSMAGFVANMLEIAPQYSSIVLGLSNSFSTIADLIAPVLNDFILKTPSTFEFKAVVFTASGIYLFAIFFYAIFASGKIQPWACPDQNEPDRSEMSA